MWDEVKISAGLSYDTNEDRIVGTEEWGKTSTNELADHAIVFGIHGVQSQMFFTIGYGFCEGQTDSSSIVEMVEDVVKVCKDNNFNIIASVCDQGSNNSKAVRSLVKQTDRVRQKLNLENCKF